MSSIRIKNLQSASPLIDEQFNEMQFVVDMDEPNTTLKVSGAELKEAVGVQAHGHTIAEVEELQTALDRKLDKSGGTITGDLKVEGNARIKSLQVEEYLEVPELKYNRITATGGELWVTDAGTIDEVWQDVDGVYIVTLKANDDRPTTNFAYKDILRGIFYTETGFQTAYFEVTGIVSDTQFTCLPLNNIAPHRFMTLARQGNKTNADRQGSVYIDGKRISDQNERLRSTKVCKEITIKHGLYMASGKENVKREQLREPDATKYRIYDALVKNVPLSRSWAELQSRLRADGIVVGFKNKGSTSQVEGVRFAANSLTINGSKVDKQFSYSKIDFALRQNSREIQMQDSRVLQPKPSLPKQEYTPTDSGNLLSDIGGLFGELLTPNPAENAEENEFRRRMQRKKKKGIKR